MERMTTVAPPLGGVRRARQGPGGGGLSDCAASPFPPTSASAKLLDIDRSDHSDGSTDGSVNVDRRSYLPPSGGTDAALPRPTMDRPA